MARVYWGMDFARRESQDGARLVYILTQIAKVLELTEVERRLIRLEEQTNGKRLPGTGPKRLIRRSNTSAS
jgi:hypothetical protein